MATENVSLKEVDEKNNKETSGSTKKNRSNRPKQTASSINSNSEVENINNSVSESNPSELLGRSDTKQADEAIPGTVKHLQLRDQNSNTNDNTNFILTDSLQSNATNTTNIRTSEQIELNTITDENEDDQKVQDVSRATDVIITGDPLVTSYTTDGDNDVIEIHEFSIADIDVYLDIYFETLHDRLTCFIGGNDEVEQFRKAMKNRISSDSDSREYQNVFIGKVNGEAVAAVTLSFPGDATTISNNNILPQANSCLASIIRWMARKANYTPTSPYECYIEMIGVKSEYRKRGIGTAMLEYIEHLAQLIGITLLTVHTNGNQLRNYFQRFGFIIDRFDGSALWKWAVEKQSITKLSKTFSPNTDYGDAQADNRNGYSNPSVVEDARQ